jgi:hypothetical protein
MIKDSYKNSERVLVIDTKIETKHLILPKLLLNQY